MHLSETFESPFLFDSRHGKFQWQREIVLGKRDLIYLSS
jgi:hypothetical protein